MSRTIRVPPDGERDGGGQYEQFNRLFQRGGPVSTEPLRVGSRERLRASPFGNPRGKQTHALDVVHLPAARWAGLQLDRKILCNQEHRRGQSIPQSSHPWTKAAPVRGGSRRRGGTFGDGDIRLSR